MVPLKLSVIKFFRKSIIGFFCLFLLTTSLVFASTRVELVTQQIDLLKERLVQAKNELAKLQSDQDRNLSPVVSLEHVSKPLLTQIGLDIATSKSNRDSLMIELAESQQNVSNLEKTTQEIENQLNVYSVFGTKISHVETSNILKLQSELKYQKSFLILEKSRANYLQSLQDTANAIYQLNKARFSRVEALLKSQTIMQLKEKQAQSELHFQQQQSYWLAQLNDLYAQLHVLESKNELQSPAHQAIEQRIFYANEMVNSSYLQMLIMRYGEELHQFKVNVAHSSSITLLNDVTDQAQVLGKQLTRVKELLKERVSILEKRQKIISKTENVTETQNLTTLTEHYQSSIERVDFLSQKLITFRAVLEKALQHELSSRQGIPGFNAKSWVDLGAEMLLIPSLTFQMVKSLMLHLMNSVSAIQWMGWMFVICLEIVWVSLFYLLSLILKRFIAGVPDHEFGHINLKWLLIKLTRRNLIDIAIIGNAGIIFYFCKLPPQNYLFLINLGWVWLFFKVLLTAARLCLIESIHDRAGQDVRLYYRLKWSFIVGGIITALTVFINQLPLVYEIKDLFDRMFLLFLLVVSVFILKSWEVLPGLILPHVDDKHTYVKRVVRLMGILIPFIILVNSAIGLCGFVNFIQTISWYENVFLLVLLGYLFVRGLVSDGFDLLSQLFIRHVANGWLWTEAFLKPLDKVVRLFLFFTAGVILFDIYGWDRQSGVVRNLIALLNYQIVNVLDTSIALINLIELAAVISVLIWGARWIREFVYRLLASKTQDLGVRNSMAILSQYCLIVIGVFVCLRVLGIDFRALTVVAGAFAFGVGLGLRDLVNNFACGFLLLLERPIRVGDTVTINEHEGEVVHIGGRAVTVRTWDHMDVLVPNAEIFSKTFMNWTAKDSIVRTVIDIKINRHDSPHDVQSIIYQVLAAHKAVLKSPVPEVFLKELSDGMIEFEVRYFVNLRLVKSRVEIRSEVLVAIWEAFERSGIKPPYPHHEIFVKGGELSRMLTLEK